MDAFILDNLPGTFSRLCGRAGERSDAAYRPIDRGLQRLRKQGKITFDRKGRDCVWRLL
jgi:hypothetical protein